MKGEVFYPGNSGWWLGYWFTPALEAAAYFSRGLALAQGAFALIRRLSPPGAGLPPYLCHRLATSLVAPILLYHADLFTPSVGTTSRLDTLRHKVQTWTTNCFSATPTGILSVESCLPPVSLLITHRQRLAALRVVCSPPSVNPATARLHPSFPSLSAHWAPDCSWAVTRRLSSVYLPLHWKTPRPVPPIRNHLPVDTVAHGTIPFTHGLSRMAMINSHLVCPTPPPPAAIPDEQHLFRPEEEDHRDTPHRVGLPLPNSGYYLHPRILSPMSFMGLGKFIAGRMHQMRAGKSYLAPHPTCRSPDADSSCPRCRLK